LRAASPLAKGPPCFAPCTPLDSARKRHLRGQPKPLPRHAPCGHTRRALAVSPHGIAPSVQGRCDCSTVYPGLCVWGVACFCCIDPPGGVVGSTSNLLFVGWCLCLCCVCASRWLAVLLLGDRITTIGALRQTLHRQMLATEPFRLSGSTAFGALRHFLLTALKFFFP